MLRCLLPTTLVVLACTATSAFAAEPTAADVSFFENKIRPVLVKHCYECHSADAKEVGGKLLLDTRDGIRRGGETGPALVPGKPDASLIVLALRYESVEMPPDAPLPPQVIADFAEWVRRGAPDPRVLKAAAVKTNKPNEGSTPTELWSLRPVQDPPLPAVKSAAWVRDPLDRFILARIEAAGLQPAVDADPRSLLRRLSFDLVGLPPLFEEIEAFAADYQADPDKAIATAVDRLLASPQFGTHWARYWLDVARYGESNGNDGLSRNPTFPHAWRYRDYVIAALNDDLPYDQFIAEQIAGDLMPYQSPEERDRKLMATGFLAIGSKPAKAMNTNFEMDVVADQIDVVGRGVLGLTVACARCHDHKFDPIPTRDYYALAGIFASSETLWGAAAHDGLTAPTTDLHVLQTAKHVPPPKDFVETVVPRDSATGKAKPIPKSKWPPGTPVAMGVRERAKIADAKINIKGEMSQLGASVPRGFLAAVQFPARSDDEPDESADEYAIDDKSSGRLQLARWLTRPDHPLTARVMANRIWQQLFGEGIVSTPDEFGVYGEPPSDPELLDHLATRFVRDAWSMKRLIRAIVLSRTYRVTSDAAAELVAADPQNRLFARHVRRRLTAEALRDAMLWVSGRLDLNPGDGSIIRHRDILVNRAGNLHEPSNHRSIYLCYLRSSPPPDLAAFDLPEFTGVVGRRDVSTMPSQALYLFNNAVVVAQAKHFAAGLKSLSGDSKTRVQTAWTRAYGRLPSDAERQDAQSYLQAATKEMNSDERAWQSLCQALLISSEFRYVE
jgi:hypothetical protein